MTACSGLLSTGHHVYKSVHALNESRCDAFEALDAAFKIALLGVSIVGRCPRIIRCRRRMRLTHDEPLENAAQVRRQGLQSRCRTTPGQERTTTAQSEWCTARAHHRPDKDARDRERRAGPPRNHGSWSCVPPFSLVCAVASHLWQFGHQNTVYAFVTRSCSDCAPHSQNRLVMVRRDVL